MARRSSSLLAGVSILFAFGIVGVAACSVDSSKFTFDDEKFREQEGKGSGGKSQVGGASSSGGRAGGGEGGLPEASGGGDMGGSASGGAGNLCVERELRCNGKQVEICTGTAWLGVGPECEFVCQDGGCTGVCDPDDAECVNEKERRYCDSSGQWQNETCENACIGTACGGECSPGSLSCGTPTNGQIPVEVCVGGDWDATTTICDSGCTDGKCTGGCQKDDTQCAVLPGGTHAVLTCPADGADWADATTTTCENQACVNGVCTGVCKPGTSECSGKTRRVCSAQGDWESEECQFLCSATESGCVGECEPGRIECAGDNVVKCNELARWDIAEKCENTCATLSSGKTTCVDCPPTPGVNFCYFTEIVTCNEEGRWEQKDDCATRGYLCGGGTCFKENVCPTNADTTGCFDSEKGWYCAKPGIAAERCTCDCSSGNDCARGCIGLSPF
jgi:hypothetical protein